MRKSGQPATKADSGGQRTLKSPGATTGSNKPAPKKDAPPKKEAGKKPGA
jgi:hypothetical protein